MYSCTPHAMPDTWVCLVRSGRHIKKYPLHSLVMRRLGGKGASVVDIEGKPEKGVSRGPQSVRRRQRRVLDAITHSLCLHQ